MNTSWFLRSLGFVIIINLMPIKIVSMAAVPKYFILTEGLY